MRPPVHINLIGHSAEPDHPRKKEMREAMRQVRAYIALLLLALTPPHHWPSMQNEDDDGGKPEIEQPVPMLTPDLSADPMQNLCFAPRRVDLDGLSECYRSPNGDKEGCLNYLTALPPNEAAPLVAEFMAGGLVKKMDTLRTTHASWLLSVLGSLLLHSDSRVSINSAVMLGGMGIGGVTLLVEILANPFLSDSIRENATFGLGKTKGGPMVEEVLVMALSLQSGNVRAEAAFSLYSIGSKNSEAFPLLISLLKTGSPGEKAMAALALGHYGEPAVAALNAALDDESLQVNLEAISSLSKIGAHDTATVSALMKKIMHPKPFVSYAAIKLLVKIGEKSVGPHLRGLLESSLDEKIKFEIETALHSLDPNAYPFEGISAIRKIEKEFGVLVKNGIGSDFVPGYKTQPLEFEELVNSVEEVETSLAFYPPQFLANSGLKIIYLGKMNEASGVFYSFAPNAFVSNGDVATNNHECLHGIDFADGGLGNEDPDWIRTAYGEEEPPYFYDDESYKKMEERPKGFAYSYGMCNPDEDQATVMESLFGNYRQMMEWAKDDLVLAKKIGWMKKFLYRMSDGRFDLQFWEDLLADKKIDQAYWSKREANGDFTDEKVVDL